MNSLGMMRGAWQFRDFIAASVKREFVARYQGTQLGILWPILQPLAMILIYTLVFAEVMKPRLPDHESRFAYSIYLTAGVAVWGLFADLLNRSVGIFVQNAGLLKKVSVPKVTFPIIASISALIQFSIILFFFLAFLVLSDNFPGAPLMAVVPVLVITIAFAIGLGVLLGTINVFYRDVEQSVNLVLQFWFWLTPIVYPSKALPGFMATLLAWNPMWPVVRAMQDIFLGRAYPDWGSLAYPGVLAVCFLVVARVAFKKLSDELVDEL
jgi:lipopolysaccharide transport system permease protein